MSKLKCLSCKGARSAPWTAAKIHRRDDLLTMAATATPQPNHAPTWLDLKDPKQWSRLLYPNPVSFLTTTSEEEQLKNVMVSSWLTATNNVGHLVLSVNQRRHSHASLISGNSIFGLSVPVDGMQELILEVGSRKGKFGSKFPEDYSKEHREEAAALKARSFADPPTSTRQKRKQQRMTLGIEGLRAVGWQATEESEAAPDNSNVFFIDGTVAHIACQVDSIVENAQDDHSLIRAHVIRASVLESYWNADKNQLMPESPDLPPYLTFLGAQTFGKVVL